MAIVYAAVDAGHKFPSFENDIINLQVLILPLNNFV
jgi:hypothetical protein